jgi:hypothetical protein
MDSNNKETIYPPGLSLRIHSSVLLPTEDARSSDNDENEIFLPNDIVLRSTEHHECADKNLEGNISKRSSNSACGNHVCTSEEVGETGHLFVMTQKQQDRGESHTTTTRQFDFLASSTTRQTIVVQPAGDQLKDYGRRARARSQQQRDNRKEIKLIDSSCLLVDQIEKQRESKKGKPSKTIATSSSNTNVNSIGTKKRPRQSHHSHQTQLNTTKVARNNNKTGKLWIPDTSQIPIPSKDNQSKYVQLHFLPVGTTYEIIRKFFTGLIPQRIMILLSNRIDISVLDTSSYYDDVPYNLQELVYTNKDLRVIVKFDSIPEAGLAVDRSGETIFSKQLEMRDNRKTQNRVDDRPDAFSIGVTKISKDLASSLSKLSIDAIPGIPLHYCLLKVESKLKPLIREILWTNTQQECIVVVDKKIKSAKLHLPLTQVGCEEGDDDDDHDELLTLSGYQKYANHYNRLLTIHNDLLMTVPPNKYDEAMISIDPIVRLTAHACSVLDNEMERIDNFLYQVRTIRKMVPEERNLAE